MWGTCDSLRKLCAETSSLFVYILKDQWNIPVVSCCGSLIRRIDSEGFLYSLINITHWFKVVKEDFKKINAMRIKSPWVPFALKIGLLFSGLVWKE